MSESIREKPDRYAWEQYGVRPEILPFSHEHYEICRHASSGKWFAVFIVKERAAFGLPGEGEAEILCVKIKDPFYADFLMRQPGYLRGYPSGRWNWVSVVLDGTVAFDEICPLLDESYSATGTKAKKRSVPMPKREVRHEGGIPKEASPLKN